MKKLSIWKVYLICLLIVTVVFCVLYHQFLFGGMLYAYDDIGNDTIHQYLPVAEYELSILEQGKDNTYNLQHGLGFYENSLLAKYLFPFRLSFLLLGSQNVHIAFIVQTYLNYATICLFGLLFFDRSFKNRTVASVCAILWTFNSYAVLWGQHYSFLTNIAIFTMALYGFQLYLEEDKHWHVVIPLMALLVGIGYYVVYMSCFFFLPYGILYLVYHKKKVSYILKRIGIFIPVMILAVCMAGVYIFPSIIELFQSSRIQTNVASGFSSLPKTHTLLTIFTFVARLINTNLLGVGNSFYATTNYYECAILSVSLLFVFAFLYMVQTKYWKRVLIITAVCTAALCSPWTSQLLQFTPYSQRWTYILSMAQVLLIGFAMTHIFVNRNEATTKKRYLITILAADVIILGFLAFLCLIRIKWGVPFNIAAIITVVIILLVYHIAFFFLWKTRFGYRALVISVALELILANYITVNDRGLVSLDAWKNSYAYDGTEQAVQWIKDQDNSLYRINKTYCALSDNDSLLLDYNSVSVYHATSSSHLLDIAHSYGYSDAGSHVNFINNTVMENTTMGVKYVITQKGTEMDPDFYTLVYDNDTHCVFQNDYYLGFGYLYQEQMPESDFYALPAEEATKLLSRYYYVTGSNDARSVHTDQPVQFDNVQLQANLVQLQKNRITDFAQNGNTFTGAVNNPYDGAVMLCIPLVYSENWVVCVDGEEVSAENINGGFVGIPLTAGKHSVSVAYVSYVYTIGVLCSVAGIAGYALFLLLRQRYYRKMRSV